jgi:CubicO group peptidase (beta-lactamase class C family)
MQPEAVGLSSARLAKIGPWMERLVADKKFVGLSVAVMRRGELAYFAATGHADLARGAPFARDTLVRIYSMTKPLTTTAIMMLYEDGRFQLDDPIAAFLSAFANMRVFTGGSRAKPETVPAARDITFRDLLTHTSGLSYGFMDATPIDAIYRDTGVDFQLSDLTLAEVADKAAAVPLLAHPGTAWNYSIATDIVGRLVEVMSGQPFDSFLTERVLTPLGMADTVFQVTPEKLPRFAACYARGSDGAAVLADDPTTSRFLTKRLPSGGGGLVGSIDDYLKFCRFILNKGELNGVRLLGRKTVELMTANHLPGDLAAMGQARFSESSYVGIGFGLGFSVMLNPAAAQILGTPGEVAWGGAASTAFWIDPQEDMAVVLFSQLLPSSAWPIRRELRVLTYQAVID